MYLDCIRFTFYLFRRSESTEKPSYGFWYIPAFSCLSTMKIPAVFLLRRSAPNCSAVAFPCRSVGGDPWRRDSAGSRGRTARQRPTNRRPSTKPTLALASLSSSTSADGIGAEKFNGDVSGDFDRPILQSVPYLAACQIFALFEPFIVHSIRAMFRHGWWQQSRSDQRKRKAASVTLSFDVYVESS